MHTAAQNRPLPPGENRKKERSELVDFLRGFTMLLVLYQHANAPFSDWILLFHMPLLFLLSGYLEAMLDREEAFPVFLKKKCRRLLIPYAAFEGLNLLLWIAVTSYFGTKTNVGSALLSIVTCINTDGYTGFYGRLWFWPCLFVSELIFYWVRRFSRSRPCRLWLAAGALLVLSWILSRETMPRLPFTVDIAFFAASFLLLGYGGKEPFRRLLERQHFLPDLAVFCLSGILLYISAAYGKAFCLMFCNDYGPFLWTVLAALTGAVCGILCAKWLYRILRKIGVGKQLFLWYGRNSLGVFPVHLYIKVALTDYLFYFMANSGIGILMRWCEQVRAWYVVFAAMVLVSIPLVWGITAFAPFMLGAVPGKRRT